ncbi:bifunctional diaminohydroxyphosphoribosylaminopyrimidine deaminase/5-amino-6-(5-phosphoribosylamino)uracil reductase RibD [Helicobacter sp. MIT 99-5507]|nr:bifunctional diaminohydroxyphosphoribosylaminopyrimidine deaminase/5-amino-6-(5-phosphoribosylamino)uracil reductase RibD [Helicobacter sp. MIT 99-5507]
MVNYDFYMDIAISKAWESQALALPNPAVGALILDSNNAIIALESHKVFGGAHAELAALKTAFINLSGDTKINEIINPFEIYDYLVKNHNGYFYHTKIFVTLEPCAHSGKTPSCARLLSILKPSEVIISHKDINKPASGGIDILKSSSIKVTYGILENKGRDLLFPFLCMCEKSSFILYKIAQRLNGSFENGIISSKDSMIYSHKMRSIANNIIISQKTILTDNPLLDSRLVCGNAPNVIAIGRENRLEKNLNIFKANREVVFANNIDKIALNGFNICEGGANFFEFIKDRVDCLLVFLSPNMQKGRNFFSDFNGRILQTQSIGRDIALWIKRD